MREFKSRKKQEDNNETWENEELQEFKKDSVEFFRKHKKVLALGAGFTIAFMLLFGTIAFGIVNRAVEVEQTEQLAEVETTGEVIKITTDEGLTEAAFNQSEKINTTIETGIPETAETAAATGEDRASKAAAGSGRKASNGNSSGAASGKVAGAERSVNSEEKETNASTVAAATEASTGSFSANTASDDQEALNQILGVGSSGAKLDKADGTKKASETNSVLSNEPYMDSSSDTNSDSETETEENAQETKNAVEAETPAETTKETVAETETAAETEKETEAETKAQKTEGTTGSNSGTVTLPLEKKKLTVLVYMIGSSLETKSNLAANSLVTMLSANLKTDDINVVIETGGTKDFHNISTADKEFDESKIERWMISGTKLIHLGDGGNTSEVSMTDGDSFEAFLKYVKKNFPAKRYEAVLWGQSGGPVSGFGYDEVNGSGEQLTLTEMSTALSNADMDLDLLLFDARLMGAMETGYGLSSHVDYMIASEDNEYCIGLNYTNWLKKLNSNPELSAIEQGKQVIDDFIAVNKGKGEGKDEMVGAYSLVDLKALKRNTSDRLKALAELLKSAEKTENGRDHLRQASKEAYRFAPNYSYDLVDFSSFLGAIESNFTGSGSEGINYKEIREAAASLRSSVENAVEISRYVTPNDDGGVSGLTIYFPQPGTDAEKKEKMLKKYEGLNFSTSYQQLIKQYAE
ncbi:hypothetical protein SAMN05216349_11520 [Oribacterium sp. KHPX15]|uniref:clostripain-related cysteine peptidase n=1 Tax=Oribacterium sp. KHPX15 TaxID=1855342 RepID=UPI00089BB089|nr:clostripain-related cysteine peptidase [Oribacterium sp. KHPX15]SEA51762.1 hypothetical protein SAMN05216349_11520 [Oribacterium sp. KHPX15]